MGTAYFHENWLIYSHEKVFHTFARRRMRQSCGNQRFCRTNDIDNEGFRD